MHYQFVSALCLLVLLQLADSLNLFSLLVDSGIQENEAKALKGVYDRGQPLIQLGTVVATSMSLSLVPLITKEKMQNGCDGIKRENSIRFKNKYSCWCWGDNGIIQHY